MVKNYGLIPL